MRRIQTNNYGISGRILIELVLVTPLLLMIPGAVFELSRYIRLNQVASVFSQEAANQVYRQCSDFVVFREDATNKQIVSFQETLSTTKTDDCLNNATTGLGPQMQAQLATYLPGSSLVLSVYRYNYGGIAANATTLKRVAIYPAQTGSNQFVLTRYAVSGTTLQRSDSVTLVQSADVVRRQRIVVAEVTFGYQPIIGLFRAFFGNTALQTNGVYRETTVL